MGMETLMCGIVGGYVNKPINIKAQIRAIYESQKVRGTKGFGLGIRKPDGTLLRDRTIDDTIFDSAIWSEFAKGDYFLFHHRQPTSTPNIPECNHPIISEENDLMVIHNGHIVDDKTTGEHEYETAIVTTAQVATTGQVISESVRVTDTEFALHLFEEYLALHNIKESLNKIGETYRSTFVYLASNIEGLLFVANTNPLWYYKYYGNCFVSSLKVALTQDKKCKDDAIDLEPRYGWMVQNGIAEFKGDWRTTFTPVCNHNWNNNWNDNYVFGSRYDEFLKEEGQGLTEMNYREWLTKRTEADRVKKDSVTTTALTESQKQDKEVAKSLFEDDAFVDFLPPGMTLAEHMKQFPGCSGMCEECSFMACFNNPVADGFVYGGMM